MSDEAGFKVEKLNGDNYYSWKFQMKMYLIGKDLWEIVSGSEEFPEETASAAVQRAYRKRENLALATICLSVATNLQIYVRSAKTAKEAWECLEQHFQKKSLSQKILHRRKLYSARMKNGESMIEHINYIKTLSEHLEAVGDPIEEKDLVIILVSSLTDDYNYLITALETIAEEKLTWDYVRDRLIHEHEKLHKSSSEKVHQENEALFSSRNANREKNQSAKKGKCFYCQGDGHYAKYCFKKKADQRKKKSQGKFSNSASANTAEVVDQQEGTEDDAAPQLALTVLDSSENVDDWCIDSGATQHMTHEKDKMSDFVKFKTPAKSDWLMTAFYLHMEKAI